jgi:hypothetical protein
LDEHLGRARLPHRVDEWTGVAPEKDEVVDACVHREADLSAEVVEIVGLVEVDDDVQADRLVRELARTLDLQAHPLAGPGAVSEDAEAARVRDRGDELGPRGPAHPGAQNRHVDPEHFAERGVQRPHVAIFSDPSRSISGMRHLLEERCLSGTLA